ncbi:isoquinoline 1-oxidoreductase, alpha subunit [Alteromonadaceae bacterium Bs31]|nr:isoquinoline 1-oxidoreductase, alpha subunit [Alteromonadaceae bacterium Bs31]
MKTSFMLNGTQTTVDAPEDATLLWAIRERLKLTGTKYSCGIGVCGACIVHIDGVSVMSCGFPLAAVEGRAVTTIEGLSQNNDHPIQKAFQETQAPQCGYCFSGQVMHAAALMNDNPRPSEAEIVEHMDAVLCRCGAYPDILSALKKVAKGGQVS